MENNTRRERLRRRRRRRFRTPLLISMCILLAAALTGIFIFLVRPNLDIIDAARRARLASLEEEMTEEPETEEMSTGGTRETGASEEEPPEEVKLTGLRFAERSVTLDVGEKKALLVYLLPEGVKHTEEVTLLVSDPNIINVDQTGLVTALEPGSAWVEARAGGFRLKCFVHVHSHITGIEMDEETLEINKGDEAELSFRVFPENATDRKRPEWTSSDDAVAVVDEQGKVTAVGAGEADITARLGDFFAVRTVKVNVPIQALSFSTDHLKIRNGDSVTLPVSVSPADATEAVSITFRSLNENTVRIDQNGTITGVGAGTSRVIAECGEYSTYADITVVIPVTGVDIYPGEITLSKGDTAQLSASVVPGDTTDERYIDWSSDNAKAASVSNGVVTALGAGDARIAAFHDDYIAHCLVHVISPLKGIYLNQYSLSLIEGSTGGFSVGYDPEDTTDDRSVQWTSDDESVATVSGGVVTAVSPGTCLIHAVVGEQSVYASVEVTPFIEVESLSLSHSAIGFENIGDSVGITASVYPENATGASVSFMSSDPSVATVSSSGTVTSVGSGDCVITAVCGSASAVCSVHVNAANIVVVLDPGHCDTFTGAYNDTYGIREEIINLQVARACRDYLLANYAGVTVYLTHEDGSPVDGSSLGADLQARAQFAQDRGAAVLVSLHFNASSAHNASGAVCYVSDQDNVKSACRTLGNSILSEICGRTGLQNRGCESAKSDQYFDSYGNPLDYYAINRHCATRGIPGIIVEHCFMDVDTQFITSGDWLNTFGAADAIGIANYLGLPHK